MSLNHNDPNRRNRMSDAATSNYALGGLALVAIIALGLMLWPRDTATNTRQVQRDSTPTQNVVPPANNTTKPTQGTAPSK